MTTPQMMGVFIAATALWWLGFAVGCDSNWKNHWPKPFFIVACFAEYTSVWFIIALLLHATGVITLP